MDISGRLMTLEMEVNDLYEIFLHEILKKLREGNNREILKEVKEGVKLKFSFEDIIKDRFTEKVFAKTKNGREVGGDIVKIKIGKEMLLKKDFEDEMLERTRLIRSWMWENMTTEKVGKFRGEDEDDGE